MISRALGVKTPRPGQTQAIQQKIDGARNTQPTIDLLLNPLSDAE